VESSSGSAIHELKRRYDQLAGVGPTLRSPYAITGFVNQHGKTMYRLGYVTLFAINSSWLKAHSLDIVAETSKRLPHPQLGLKTE
jgi:hypothetical protein